jgi:hypothetical protein
MNKKMVPSTKKSQIEILHPEDFNIKYSNRSVNNDDRRAKIISDYLHGRISEKQFEVEKSKVKRDFNLRQIAEVIAKG